MTDYVVFPLDSGPTVSVVVSIATQRQGAFPMRSSQPLRTSSRSSRSLSRTRWSDSSFSRSSPLTSVASPPTACWPARSDAVTSSEASGDRFADLRGFTAASQRLDAEEFLALIGTFFEHTVTVSTVSAVVLNSWAMACSSSSRTTGIHPDLRPRASLSEALTKAIDQHNASTDGLPIRFGCALHYGAVLYGNIGSPARLDFTVVGSAVNLTLDLSP